MGYWSHTGPLGVLHPVELGSTEQPRAAVPTWVFPLGLDRPPKLLSLKQKSLAPAYNFCSRFH